MEPAEFARQFSRFMSWAHEAGDGQADGPVTSALREHLGADAADLPVVARELAPFEQVNLQIALERWVADRDVQVVGYSVPPHHMHPELAQLLSGEGLPRLRRTAPPLADLPSGPGRTTAVWRTALLLVRDDRGASVLLVRGPERHQQPTLTVEVAGLPGAQAQEVLAELDALRARHNVYRGQVLELRQSNSGVDVLFPVLPRTERADVVLPEEVLARVERHSIGIAEQRDALRAAGQHLKRGLLLFGPPGTGKTHTTRYVVQHVPGATVLLLSGRSLHLVGEVTQLARDLEPAVVVLEDVDLVAEDRGHSHGPQPVLFELLDAMDGAASDADLLFVLTTNRAEALEHALAARPGRVDVAVEIGLPDADARRRLLEVYGRGSGLAVGPDDVEHVVGATAGVTASFIKELVRRAVLESLLAGATDGTVTGEHLRRALDDLLDSTQEVTRALLGVPGQP
ncbi:AAA family ATPase [Klenkia brasiliensis]|uniref:AAA family ATPase n=1 Tax=Klenkia brasiliensis TaxID=333142 RepID=UPI000B844992|nr:ATP-binding protein [Klenkia brasiliensis]